MFLHGLGASKATWQFILPAFEERYRVVMVDLLGHGGSSAPPGREYAPSAQARLLRDLVQERDLRNLVLIGWSYGGATALELSMWLERESPSRLRGLVLIDAPAFPFPPPPEMVELRNPLARWFVICFGGTPLTAELMLRGSFADARRIPPELVGEYARPLSSAATRRAVMMAADQLFEDLDARAAHGECYGAITCPSLVLWGDKDTIVPLELGRRIARILPRGRLEVISDCGHSPAEEQPGPTARLIERWLADIR